jgi:DNA-binding MarR family transcriptional regulator
MSISNLTPNQQLKLIQTLLKEFREIDPWMGVQTAETFIVIAMRPGVSMSEVSEDTGLAQSSCSRNVALLSKWHRLGKPGANLVEAVEDPRERRRKIMYLNPRGIAKVRSILSRINPDATFNVPTAKEALKGYM